MIRFILKRKKQDTYNEVLLTEEFETILLDVPQLEEVLKRGGHSIGGPGYDLTTLVGVELVRPQ